MSCSAHHFLVAAIVLFFPPLHGSFWQCCTWASGQPPETPGLTVDRRVIDVGDIFLGQNPHFEFKLKNTGAAPLRIDAHPNCGCTVAKFDETIAAGGEGKIEAELNTSGMRPGPIAKSIHVTTDASGRNPLQLSIKANIVSVIQRLDHERRPMLLSNDAPSIRVLQFKTRGPQPIEITGASCSQDCATARVELLPSVGGDDRHYKLTVTIDKSAPAGRTPMTVLLATTSDFERVAMVNFVLEKGILVTPSAVVLKQNPEQPKQSLPAVLTLTRRDGSFNIRKVDCAEFDLEVITETVRDGQEYRLKLINRGQRQPGVRQRQGLVRIETDDPAQPVIEVRALAVITPPPRAKTPAPAAPAAVAPATTPSGS